MVASSRSAEPDAIEVLEPMRAEPFRPIAWGPVASTATAVRHGGRIASAGAARNKWQGNGVPDTCQIRADPLYCQDSRRETGAVAALEPLLENWLVAVVIWRAVPHGRHWLRNRKQASATVPGYPSLFGECQG